MQNTFFQTLLLTAALVGPSALSAATPSTLPQAQAVYKAAEDKKDTKAEADLKKEWGTAVTDSNDTEAELKSARKQWKKDNQNHQDEANTEQIAKRHLNMMESGKKEQKKDDEKEAALEKEWGPKVEDKVTLTEAANQEEKLQGAINVGTF